MYLISERKNPLWGSPGVDVSGAVLFTGAGVFSCRVCFRNVAIRLF